MAQDYDKIIKEIFRNSIIAFMSQITGEIFEPVSNLDPKLQKTIEKEADFFKVVQRKKTKRKEVLHVEWQLRTTWKKMRNRMIFYKALGIEITDLPVKQYVLYLGKGRPKVDTIFKDEDMDYRYHLICIKDIDYHQLLNAPDTNTALFAILGDFGKDAPDYVIEQIGQRMLQDAKGELEWQKWQRQLEIISNIHKLQEKTIKIIERMPIVYDIKSDIRYQQGTKVGLEQGVDKQATITVVNMLLETDFTNKKIAAIAAVEMPFVIKWAKALTKYEVKKIWDSFKIIEEDKKMMLKRAVATAKILVKINGLSDEIIAKICELKKTKIAQIRKVELKKLANGNDKSTKKK